MNALYTHTGKQVFRDGNHFADAADVEDASDIVAALNALPNYDALYKAARNYFHAMNRVATITAPALRDALAAEQSRRESIA